MNIEGSRKADALALSEEILSDLELRRIAPIDIARKTSRLARLLDDAPTIAWLKYEVSGYPRGQGGLPLEAWVAASKSNRTYFKDDKEVATTLSLGELQASIEAARIQLNTASDAPVQISSANPHQHVYAPQGNHIERNFLRNEITNKQATADKVLGAIHGYVSDKYYELRFGAAIESAFEIVRSKVDQAISELVPEALPTLTAALENVSSPNPAQWKNAAAACRDLLISVADKLRPAGQDVDGRAMGVGNYVNRIVDWIVNQNPPSETLRDLITSDLEYLGRRLDAATDAGNKGAHANVSQAEAARFLSGTYLLLGDILGLRSQIPPAGTTPIPQPVS